MRKMKIASALLSGLMLVGAIPVYAADTSNADAEKYVYGTVNLSYADFYYGEVNDVAANAAMDLAAADKTSEDSGAMYGYDAVTSCTTTKSKRYTKSYYEETDTSSVKIYGMKDVAIAVPESLYKDAQAAIAANKTCSNDLLDIIGRMTVTSEVPTAYKVLNGDGTLGKMSGVQTTVAAGASAAITTDSRWGDYQISVNYAGADGKTLLGAGQDLVGAVIETADGSKYGLEHLENLWLQAQEIAFAVTDGFVEPHGNTVSYKRFQNIAGKTITSITYMYADQNIVIDNLNLKVKELLSEDCGAAAENGVFNAEGKKTTVEAIVPADSSYTLNSISYGKEVLTSEQDYTVAEQRDGNKLTYQIAFKDTEHVKIGAYTVTLSDDKYEDISASFELKADMAADDIQLVNNKLVITSDIVDVQTYINAVSSVSVNGTAIRGAKGDTLFDEQGNILPDAEVSARGNVTKLFPESGTYTIEIKAAGYPTLTGTVTIGADTVNPEDDKPIQEDGSESQKVSPKTMDTLPAVPVTLAAILSLFAMAAGKKRREV